jgi:K+ transporter
VVSAPAGMEAHGKSITHASRSALFPLTLTATGVVYGDIGTSPLYTIRECFFGAHSVPPTYENDWASCLSSSRPHHRRFDQVHRRRDARRQSGRGRDPRADGAAALGVQRPRTGWDLGARAARHLRRRAPLRRWDDHTRHHGAWRHRSVHNVRVQYGFMQDPDVPDALAQARELGVEMDPEDVTFFLGRETIIVTARKGMAVWREKLFVLMARNAVRATAFFRLPPERVVELGVQVEI